MKKTQSIQWKMRQIAVAVAAALCVEGAYAIPGNTQLPTGFESVIGGATTQTSGNIMTVTQQVQTAVNRWENFSVGADAIVKFEGPNNQFNSVNFVNSGTISEIYGQISATNGNIFIANPAGVQIGASAQINVGSLYVSNKDITGLTFAENATTQNVIDQIQKQTAGAAELMSLGTIIVADPKVTFDGSRIVIDTDRLYAEKAGTETERAGTTPLSPENLIVRTNDTNNVVLGYTAYNAQNGTYNVTEKTFTVVDEQGDTQIKGYMWVEDLFQLQNISTNTGGWYALRNSIDANYTSEQNYGDGHGFAPIDDFIGRLDGLGNSIFSLTIKRSNTGNVGLFGTVKDGAVLRNFNMISGTILGSGNVGSVVGHVSVTSSKSGSVVIENIINTADVEGQTNVGGLVGKVEGAENATAQLSGLVNVGTISGTSSVGGIAGSAGHTIIQGETYNLGAVRGDRTNVGGLVGDANNITIGNEGESFQIYNQADVQGAYNVGGIVGSLTTSNGSTSKVVNVANHGTVTAQGATDDSYFYHTAELSIEDIADIADDLDSNGVANVTVATSNVGGIVGTAVNSSGDRDSLTLSNVLNDGNVLTAEKTAGKDTYYIGGNVGGVVGHAQNIAIDGATNRENTVAGAHNVGGIAGILQDSYIQNGDNDGGDISATGARDSSGKLVYERVRAKGHGGSNETFIVGNIGGIAGYLYDTKAKDAGTVGAFIENSMNRGTVHSKLLPEGISGTEVLDSMKAANVGGVVGKLDVGTIQTLNDLGNNYQNASVRYSYNTGNVQGYTGVGGVIGMMYNGSVAQSFNTGTLESTRQATEGTIDPLNMGGIVGDATEGTKASAIITDVYNAGQIGDETYEFYGRHVGGIAGRLSGDIYRSFNTGDIYNGYSVVGGIVGYWVGGRIENVFNTGNITVLNNDQDAPQSKVGGLIGAFYTYDDEYSIKRDDSILTLAYNLGTVRSFRPRENGKVNRVSGIVGSIDVANKLSISKVYTLGNLYAAEQNRDGSWSSTGEVELNQFSGGDALENSSYLYYIAPESNEFSTIQNEYTIAWGDRSNILAYKNISGDLTGTIHPGSEGIDKPNQSMEWRLYEGGLLILNGFLPNAKDYFDSNTDVTNKIESIQYGTAYNPLLTIVTAKENVGSLGLDWNALGIESSEGLAVYGAGLDIANFDNNGNHYFAGLVYADGELTLNAADADSTLAITDGARFYGSSVTLDTGVRDALISGLLQATGKNADTGSVTVQGTGPADFEILGQLISAQDGAATTIGGISKEASVSPIDRDDLNDPSRTMPTMDALHSVTVDAVQNVYGNVSIETGGTVNLLYGNMGIGSVVASDNLTVQGDAGVYIDSPLQIGGDFNLTSNGETVLDITESDNVDYVHWLLDHFNAQGTSNSINLAGSGVFHINVNMWNEESQAYDLTKYDQRNQTLTEALNGLNVQRLSEEGYVFRADESVYIWVRNAQELAGIQSYVAEHADTAMEFLGYNFALKNNIDASALESFTAIGTGTENGFSGTFDGRGYRILGLTVENQDNAGLFTKLAASATVHDLRIYASNFEGKIRAGAIAAESDGVIRNVTTLGNFVSVSGLNDTLTENGYILNGSAGGLVGVNKGTLYGSTAHDMVVAGGEKVTAGGLVGINAGNGTIGKALNEEGELVSGDEAQYLITADSAVSATTSGAYGIGGSIGLNLGTATLVNSTGVTNGRRGTDTKNALSNVGGIAGVNAGTMVSLYNESIVMGNGKVGGIVGVNEEGTTIRNAVNTSAVDGLGEYVGGMAGHNSGSITSGRNTGTVTGDEYVGGMVGYNGEHATLNSLSNALSAEIYGQTYVGGIAGQNVGMITGSMDLVNEGSISGHRYVGGVAGQNDGSITATNTEVTIKAVAGTDEDDKPSFFGGVAGLNNGTIEDVRNGSDINLNIEGGSLVGGIAGQNNENGKFVGELVNEGAISGLSGVGGILGSNLNQSLLVGKEDALLVVTNKGDVTATEGGAAGIFYQNSGEIKFAVLTNTGSVSGKESEDSATNSTGGLFGVNAGDISDATLINSGTVAGGANTGGLIGTNSGNVSKSSLINTVGAYVTGGENTGGLIGLNSGTIAGGRIEGMDDLLYYGHQIYNNGAVEGALNVGGLIGQNKGSLTAAYNTGSVVSDLENGVGGIVGLNTGKIDQVFNTVLLQDADGETGSIQGKGNVGGVVGVNQGELSNAYNSTTVKGATNVGNLVGYNQGTVEDVFATNETGVMFGQSANNARVAGAYSYSQDDRNSDTVHYIAPDKTSAIDSYASFDFGDKWKIYEGLSTPMLRVFLTQTKVSDIDDVVYNAQEHDFENHVTAGDQLAAYNNANKLLNNIKNTNAGDYAVSSQQIAIGTDGSHNNLGYDIDLSYTINKAQLNVTLDEISRVYGSLAFDTTKAEEGENSIRFETDRNGYGLVVSVGSDLTDKMKDEIEKGLTSKFESDGSLTGASTGRITQDVGQDYVWTAGVDLGSLAQNYEFAGGSSQIKAQGKAAVTPAKLFVNVNDADVIYGRDKETVDFGYTIEEGSGAVNGDSLSDILVGMNYDSDAFIKDGGDRKTNNVGRYVLTGEAVKADGTAAGNYEIVVSDGTIDVNAAKLFVNVNDADVIYGRDKETVDFGYTIEEGSGAVNGDSLSDILVGMNYDSDAFIKDDGDRKTNNVGRYVLTGEAVKADGTAAGNYEIVVSDGTIDVNAAKLFVNVNDADVIYGRDKETVDFGYTIEEGSGAVNGDSLSDILVGMNYDSDAFIKDGGDRKTNNVGRYVLTGEAVKADGTAAGNYEIVVSDGTIDVNAAKLYVNVNDVDVTYGTDKGSVNFGYSLEEGSVAVNGDELSEVLAGMDYSSDAFIANGGDRKTNDVGSYDLVGTAQTGSRSGNYDIVVGDGTVTVNPAKLEITAGSVTTWPGVTPDFTGTTITEIVGQFVNGDQIVNVDLGYGLKDDSILNVLGHYEGVISLVLNGKYYGGGTYNDWNGVFSNYKVTIKTGNLDVVTPQIPIEEPTRYGYIYQDGWDRSRVFRERKAAIEFVEGGVNLSGI